MGFKLKVDFIPFLRISFINKLYEHLSLDLVEMAISIVFSSYFIRNFLL